MEIENYYTIDGDHWATFTKGHVDKNEFIKEADVSENNKPLVEHAYLIDRGGECEHHFCKKNEKGSFKVTAVRY